MSVSFFYVRPEDIESVWPSVIWHLQKAVDECGGEYTAADVKKDLLTSKALLWVGVDEKNDVICTVVTSINQYERKRSLFVRLLAGEAMKYWFHHESHLAEYARLNDCASIETYVIPSVGRLAKYLLPDYQVTHHILVKKL